MTYSNQKQQREAEATQAQSMHGRLYVECEFVYLYMLNMELCEVDEEGVYIYRSHMSQVQHVR